MYIQDIHLYAREEFGDGEKPFDSRQILAVAICILLYCVRMYKCTYIAVYLYVRKEFGDGEKAMDSRQILASNFNWNFSFTNFNF